MHLLDCIFALFQKEDLQLSNNFITKKITRNYKIIIIMRLIYAQRIMFAVFIFCTFFLPNCSDQQRNSLQSLPTALGSPTQTLLVVDDDFEGTIVGDSILFNFEAAYPLLPAPEPMLDLTTLKFDDFFGMKQQWRNIIFIANFDEPSPLVDFIKNTIGEEAVQNAKDNPDFNYASQNNRWAKNQQVGFIFAHGEQQLADAISQRAEKIIQKVYESDKQMIKATTYSMGYDEGINNQLREEILVDLKVPGDYRVALEEDGHYWLRKETRKADLGLLIRKLPYEGDLRVDEETLIKIQKEFGKKYITSTGDSYMTIDMKNLTPPIYFNQTAVNGNFTQEARGVWKMQNGFMGGAFISYLIYHKPTQSLLFMDGFVYAPEQSKRKYLQRLKMIMDSATFLGSN